MQFCSQKEKDETAGYWLITDSVLDVTGVGVIYAGDARGREPFFFYTADFVLVTF